MHFLNSFAYFVFLFVQFVCKLKFYINIKYYTVNNKVDNYNLGIYFNRQTHNVG